MVDAAISEEGGVDAVPRVDRGNEQPQQKQAERGYQLLTLEQLFATPASRWLVHRVIRRGDLVTMFADAGCFKTFVAIDLVLKIAAGRDWWGYKVQSGGSVYLAGEGSGGLCNRIRAWGIENEVRVTDLNVRVLAHSIAMMEDREFGALAGSIAQLPEKPALIVVDTLARYMGGGDENSSLDMGRFVERCAQLRNATGAAVLIIHHTGKNSDSERGSSVLRCAMDVMIHVKCRGAAIEVVGEKSRDHEPLPSIYLTFKSHSLGVDGDNEGVTSLVLVETQKQQKPRQPAAPFSRETIVASSRVDQAAAIRHALAVVFAGVPTLGSQLLDASKLQRSTFYKVLAAEIAAGRIEASGERYPKYWLTCKAPEFASTSPSSSSTSNSESGALPSGVRESESTHPLKGVAVDSNANSSGAHTFAHQDVFGRQAIDGVAGVRPRDGLGNA